MGGKFCGAAHFQNIVKIATAKSLHMGFAAFHVVIGILLAFAGFDGRQVADGFPEWRMVTGARRGFDFRAKIIRQVEACADEKLTTAFLWQAEFDTILNLGVDTVANRPRLFCTRVKYSPPDAERMPSTFSITKTLGWKNST